MLKIDCCKYEQKPTEIKEISSNVEGCRQTYFYLECCVKCGQRTVKVFTIDKNNKVINGRRIKPKNIDSFFKNIKVIRELPTASLQRVRPRPMMIVSEGSRKMARIRDPK